MIFNQDRPIYIQIIENIKKQLIRGELKPQDKIPSQRDFAKTISVNPNTVQRAYQEMERIGLVQTLRGQGTFITTDEKLLGEIKKEMAADIINNFLKEMKSLGFENKSILEQIKIYLQEGKHD